VGRASDVTPVAVPNVIARKTINAPAPTFLKKITHPRKGRARALPPPPPPASNDEYAVTRGSDDPVRPPSLLPLLGRAFMTLTAHGAVVV